MLAGGSTTRSARLRTLLMAARSQVLPELENRRVPGSGRALRS